LNSDETSNALQDKKKDSQMLQNTFFAQPKQIAVDRYNIRSPKFALRWFSIKYTQQT